MQTQALEAIGLTKSEALTYLALLRTGFSSTGPLVKEANISSGKIYEILDKLIEKGLISSSLKNNVKYFQAAHPEKIKDYVERKKKEFEEQEKEAEKLIPQLNIIAPTTSEEGHTLVYEGFEGVKTAIFETLEKEQDKEWLALGVSTKRSTQWNNLWKHWHKERIKRKIDCKMILADKDSMKEYQKTKLLQEKLLGSISPTPLGIFGNTVMIYDWDQPSVIVIHNKKVAQSFTSFFNSLWKLAH